MNTLLVSVISMMYIIAIFINASEITNDSLQSTEDGMNENVKYDSKEDSLKKSEDVLNEMLSNAVKINDLKDGNSKNKSSRTLTFRDVVTLNWDKDENRVKQLERTLSEVWLELNETLEDKASCLSGMRSEIKKNELLTEHLSKTLTKAKSLTKQVANLEIINDEIKSKYQDLDLKYKNSEKRYSTIESKYINIKDANTVLENKLRKLQSKMDTYETKELELSEENRSLKNKNTYIMSKYNDLEKEYKEMKLDISKLEIRNSEIIKKYSFMKKKLENIDIERRIKCDYYEI